jgi:arylsulfatase A-like enzyme
MKRRTTLWLCATMLCLAAGCTRSQPPPNIILIVADTLRADRIGAAGNPRGITPFIDSLAARGYVFHNAYAPSSWTNPSVASILTSRYQSQHGIVTFESVLADSEVTLAEALKPRGYTTGFFSANGLISRRMGFSQGYDLYRSILVKGKDEPRYLWIPERSDRINGDALGWVDSVTKTAPTTPIFLHMHYMEPHNPYSPRAEALDKIADGHEQPDVQKANGSAFFGHTIQLTPEMLTNLVDVYDAEVLSLDIGLRSLFAELEQRHLLDNAVVVITADHGEEFKEHGLIGHDKSLYEEVVRVPLIMLVPGHRERTDIDQVVSLVDIAPTLVDLAGAAIPPAFEGHSFKGTLINDPNRWRLLSWLAGKPGSGGAPGSAYTELIKNAERNAKRFTPHEHAIVLGSHKLIVGTAGEHEYYDLKADPGEKNPNGLSEAERNQLQNAYDLVRTRARERAAPRDTQELDPETRERMRALGYDH